VPGGDAHTREPLPVSLGAATCLFRPVAIEALGRARRYWRAVCEVSRMEPVYAAIEAGLAVAPLLRSSVPERFEILGPEAHLPSLPEFRINLSAPPRASPAVRDLADHVRQSFSGR
jgi:DNA-binding transcriptional LysR family regulator